MTPRDPDPGGVPLDADWPDLDAAEHRFRADYATLRETGSRLLGQVPSFQAGKGSPGRLDGAEPPAAAWGEWEAAAPVRAAAGQAMRQVLAAYRQLLADYEAAGHLLLRTAQNYADADVHVPGYAGGGARQPAAWPGPDRLLNGSGEAGA